MKKIALLPLLTLFVISLSACSVFDSQNATNFVANKKFEGEVTITYPYIYYSIQFASNSYHMTYHKDAIKTSDVDRPAEDAEADGTFSFYDKQSYTWKDTEWKMTHHVTYYIVRLSDHAVWDDGAYLTFEINSNVCYMHGTLPEIKYYSTGIKLALRQ